jgi:hypothetical protein
MTSARTPGPAATQWGLRPMKLAAFPRCSSNTGLTLQMCRSAPSSRPVQPAIGGRDVARPRSALRRLSVTRPAQMLAMNLGHQPGLFTYMQPRNLVRDGPNAATNLRFRPTYEN